MFDTHMHGDFSTDSSMEIQEAIKAAQDKNLGIIITDHFDLKYPEKGQFIFDVDKYFQKYNKYRSDKVLIGIEMGMRLDCIDENKKVSEDNPFDYVIGSVHLVESNKNYKDIYDKDFYEGKSKKEAYENYLDYMLKCVNEYDYIDSLGHMDYISRYAPYEDREIYYDEYREIIDEILKRLAKNNKAIEINSKRLRDKNASLNLIKIYKRFYELGGKIITIGSDAHDTKAIGKNFKDAREIAELSNLKIVYFKNRNPEYIKSI